MTNSNDRLDRIEELIQKNTETIQKNTETIQKNAEAIAFLEQDLRRQEDRFFQLSRDNLAIARTIIVAAGTVTLFSPLLQALAPAIETLVTRALNQGTSPFIP